MHPYTLPLSALEGGHEGEAICWHEAGHAVAALHCGLNLTGVDVLKQPGRLGPALGVAWVSNREGTVDDQFLVTAAGPAAEGLYYSSKPGGKGQRRRLDASDELLLKKLLDRACARDSRRLNETLLRDMSFDFVRRPGVRMQLEALARALEAERILDGGQARRVVNGAYPLSLCLPAAQWKDGWRPRCPQPAASLGEWWK